MLHLRSAEVCVCILSVFVQEKVWSAFILIGDPEILIGRLLIGLVPVPVKMTFPNILGGRMCAICFALTWVPL